MFPAHSSVSSNVFPISKCSVRSRRARSLSPQSTVRCTSIEDHWPNSLWLKSACRASAIAAGTRQSLAIRLQPCEAFLLRPRSVPKEHPLQGDATNSAIPRPNYDQARGLGREVPALRPLLHSGFGDRLPELGGELPIGQRDALPRAENTQEDGESLPYWAKFGSISGLDRRQ